MEIGIVGAGKVGCSIGKYLREHDIPVAGFFSKTRESVEFAATFTETKAFQSLKELLAVSDILFIATPDRCISDIWEEIAIQSIQSKIICHFSGSLSSEIFSGRKERDVYACSAHPMFAFSSKFTCYEQLNHVFITMEGDKKALEQMNRLFELTKNPVCFITPEKKTLYHAAASMASNMMIGLYEQSLRMFEACGFGREEARELIKPLVSDNVNSFLTKTPQEALTGPIERNDIDTIKKHLAVLSEQERKLYVNLGEILMELAKSKHPERNYREMSELLRRIV